MSQRTAPGGTYNQNDYERGTSGRPRTGGKHFVQLLVVLVVFLLGWMFFSWNQKAHEDQPPAPLINEQSR
jgi:hypothetical protein